jgi:hypothetical protein
VGGDVAQVAPRQPQAQRGGQGERGEEERGEGGGHCGIGLKAKCNCDKWGFRIRENYGTGPEQPRSGWTWK